MTDIAIPGYEIHEPLGVGGMATVYRARHINLDRDVAIKVMDPSLNNDPTFNERFKREARISAQLTHPHIVQVYDVDSLDGVNYLAMEYIGNGDLHDVIHEPLQMEKVYDVMLQITHALDYANSKGYVHRDIKPSNILIRDNGTYVLADFGIARATESNTQMTMTGSVIGTPSYMSPEQAQGLPLDGRSDLYSLAIVCYEMITKDLPYTSESSISTALKHLLDPIPELPPQLAQFQPFFNKALAKNRDERFQTGAEMAAALEQLVHDPMEQTVIAKPGETPPRMPTPAASANRHTPLNAWKAVPPTGETRPEATTDSSTSETPAIETRKTKETPEVKAEEAAVASDDDEGAATVFRPPPNEPPNNRKDDDTPTVAISSVAPPPRPAAQQEALAAEKAGSRAPMWLLAGIALVAGAGAAGWLALQGQPSGSDKSPSNSVAAAPKASDEKRQKINTLLEKARAASNAGNLFEPRASSAFDLYQKVQALDPDNSSAAAGLDLLLVNTVDRAQQYTAQGELELAQQELGKAALVNPSDNYLLSAKEDLAKAISAKLEAAIAAQQLQQDQSNRKAEEPGEASPRENEANEYAAAPELPVAEAPAATSPILDDDSASMSLQALSVPALLSQAQADLQLNTAASRDAALASLQEILEREPGNSDAEAMLALLLAQQLEVARIETGKGNFQKAKRAMDAARSIDPNAQLGSASGGVVELLEIGKNYEEQGEYQKAVKTYLEALLIDPNSPDIDASLHGVNQLYISAIQQHLADGELEQAAALQAEALTWFPNSEVLAGLIPATSPTSSPENDQNTSTQ